MGVFPNFINLFLFSGKYLPIKFHYFVNNIFISTLTGYFIHNFNWKIIYHLLKSNHYAICSLTILSPLSGIVMEIRPSISPASPERSSASAPWRRSSELWRSMRPTVSMDIVPTTRLLAPWATPACPPIWKFATMMVSTGLEIFKIHYTSIKH